jgi:Arc/MetJ family transcription regulator
MEILMNTRTNIVLDDELMAQAMARAGVKTKKAAVEAALKAFVRKPDYSAVLALRGKGLIDPDYDPRGPYGLTEAALERRGLKTFQEARLAHARQIDDSKKPARKQSKPALVAARARRKQAASVAV